MHMEIGERVRRRGEGEVGVIVDCEMVNNFLIRYLVAYGDLEGLDIRDTSVVRLLREAGRLRILYNASTLSSQYSTRFGSEI